MQYEKGIFKRNGVIRNTPDSSTVAIHHFASFSYHNQWQCFSHSKEKNILFIIIFLTYQRSCPISCIHLRCSEEPRLNNGFFTRSYVTSTQGLPSTKTGARSAKCIPTKGKTIKPTNVPDQSCLTEHINKKDSESEAS